MSPVQPQAIITLKVADERDRTMWVAETPEQVLDAINYAHNVGAQPLVTLTRIMGMEPSPFHTRYDNIANVEPYR